MIIFCILLLVVGFIFMIEGVLYSIEHWKSRIGTYIFACGAMLVIGCIYLSTIKESPGIEKYDTHKSTVEYKDSILTDTIIVFKGE